VNATTGTAFEGGEEERCAGRRFENLDWCECERVLPMLRSYLRLAKILFAVEVHHKHIGGLHELFLHAARRNVDFVFMANTGPSPSSCHLGRETCQS